MNFHKILYNSEEAQLHHLIPKARALNNFNEHWIDIT